MFIIFDLSLIFMVIFLDNIQFLFVIPWQFFYHLCLVCGCQLIRFDMMWLFLSRKTLPLFSLVICHILCSCSYHFYSITVYLSDIQVYVTFQSDRIRRCFVYKAVSRLSSESYSYLWLWMSWFLSLVEYLVAFNLSSFEVRHTFKKVTL